ncbi:MAG: hypothetical protein R2874_02855 [Desulfobacterales bacterium]
MLRRTPEVRGSGSVGSGKGKKVMPRQPLIKIRKLYAIEKTGREKTPYPGNSWLSCVKKNQNRFKRALKLS